MHVLFEKGEASQLNPDRIKRLEDVGFIWKAKGDDLQVKVELIRKKEQGTKRWNQRYTEMCAYKAKHGHCLVPKVYEENRLLSSW